MSVIDDLEVLSVADEGTARPLSVLLNSFPCPSILVLLGFFFSVNLRDIPDVSSEPRVGRKVSTPSILSFFAFLDGFCGW